MANHQSMMNITLLLRHHGVGYSIENLFRGIANQLGCSDVDSVQIATAPYISHNLFNVGKNIVYFWTHRNKAVHITGDIHYAAIALQAKGTLLTIHDCVLLERNRSRPVRFVLFWLLWYYWPICKAGIVTTVSEKTRQDLRRYVGKLADKIVVIPNSYDPAFVHNPQPFNTQKPILLHIGTALHKNLNRLIDAVHELPCRLLIVGELSTAETDKLRRCRIDYENHAAVSPSELVTLYNQCDLVTFVSLYEGFGMPIIEAQAVGRPVVTSQLSPMTEVGGAAGACYVNPTDVAAIRRGILRVWHDAPYRDQLTQAGLLNAEHYTVMRIAARYAALYEQLNQPPT
jgi:glycosyltransferase involved in cell wall biosynthesis